MAQLCYTRWCGTVAERDELVNSLDHCPFVLGCPTRASVLRKIIEHPAFDQKIFNVALVTMQYFGYLRRDPDPAGFRFWLSKLNQFNGNFIEAVWSKPSSAPMSIEIAFDSSR